jgi:hypothetical protein
MIPIKNSKENEFQTPKEALIPLISYIKKEWNIWECACGNGNIVNNLLEIGFNIFGSDILTGQDFLNYNPSIDYDCIITNPPYSIKDKFIYRCYELKKPFALLMPYSALETEKRQRLYRKYGLELILFNKRIDFLKKDQNKGKPYFATAWFTNGFNIGRDLTFFDFNNKQEKLF